MTELLQILDAVESTPDAVALRRRSYELLSPPRGGAVVDVGCGAGRAVAELTEQGVRAIGVDPDPAMPATARERFPGIDVRCADATALPLDAGSAVGWRADKVLHVVPDPDAALDEARRVLAPGGRIVLVGQDWEAMVVDSDLPDLTRRIVLSRATTVPHPRIARAYRNLLLDKGFRDVECEVHTTVLTGAAVLPLLTRHAEAAGETGAVTAAEVAEWLAEQTARASRDRLMLAVPMFMAAGTR